jgi:lysophospholipase L1-like esterase
MTLMTSTPASAPRLLLFIGDSITDCHRLEDPEGLGSGYVRQIAGHLAAEGAHTTVVNRGISGNKAADLVARFVPDCLDHAPDLVTIYVGVNDSWHYTMGHAEHVSEESFERDCRWMLDQLAEHLPGTAVAMVVPFVADVDEGVRRIHEDLDDKVAIIRRLAGEYGHTLVDLEQLLAGVLATGMPPERFADDGVHPTPIGHRAIADAWLDAVRP